MIPFLKIPVKVAHKIWCKHVVLSIALEKIQPGDTVAPYYENVFGGKVTVLARSAKARDGLTT